MCQCALHNRLRIWRFDAAEDLSNTRANTLTAMGLRATRASATGVASYSMHLSPWVRHSAQKQNAAGDFVADHEDEGMIGAEF
jgi:hypothetical protein